MKESQIHNITNKKQVKQVVKSKIRNTRIRYEEQERINMNKIRKAGFLKGSVVYSSFSCLGFSKAF